ncbi:MAG: hypothetical protein AB7G23_21070 [Vicinamibacterales bacterium]
MPRWGAHLVIRCPQGTGRTTRVWLNGQEQTRCLTAVTLNVAADDVTRAELSIRVDGLDIDAQSLAALAARLDPEEAAKLRAAINEEEPDAA